MTALIILIVFLILFWYLNPNLEYIKNYIIVWYGRGEKRKYFKLIKI